MIVHEMFTSVNPNSEAAKANAAKSLSGNFASVDAGVERSLVGSPKELVKKLELYSAAGVDITELKFVYSEIPALKEDDGIVFA